MNLQAYLDRIGFEGKPRPDLDTLRRLHNGHVAKISYENFDVQLGRKVTRDPEAIFDKIVTRRRGGWCYEMNGLFSWALDQVGFSHTRVAGGVRRDAMGDAAVGNHLVLLVHLERPYLADVGFGDGLREPVPLVEDPIETSLFAFRLEELGQGWWRFHNDPRGGAPSFDFRTVRADEALLDARCTWLQSDPTSPFMLNAVAQRHLPGRFAALRGRVLKTIDATGVRNVELPSAQALVATLREVFNLDLPDAAALWPRIEERHRQLFPSGLAVG